MTGVSAGEYLFVCVVGLGYVSTSPLLSGEEPARRQGATAGLPKNGHNLCRCLQHSNLVQDASFWYCLCNYASSSSCHQTIVFHSSTHCFSTSLNVMMSIKE